MSAPPRWLAALGLVVAALPASARFACPSNEEDASQASEALSPLDRRPRDLPRAAPGTWSGLYTDQGLSSEIIQALPPGVVTGMQAAEGAYRAQRYPQTLGALYGALELAPDFPPALLLLGNTQYRLRRYRDSADALERYLAHAPAQLFRTQALGHDLYTLGEYEAALEHYERVRAALIASNHALGTSLLRGAALCHLRLGDVEAALSGLDEALALEPGDPEALVWRAQLLLDEDRLDEAIVAAELARDAAPFEPRPWFLLSQALAWSGEEGRAELARARWKEVDRLTQALRQSEATLLFEPDNYGESLRRFDLLAELGNGPAARRAFDRALALRPPEVPLVLLYTHGLDALANVGEPERSAPLAAELEAQAGSLLLAWEALHVYYQRAGRPEDASRARRRADSLRN